MVSTPPRMSFAGSLLVDVTPYASSPESGYFALGQAVDCSHVGLPFYLSAGEDSGIESQDNSLLLPHSLGGAATPELSSWRRSVGTLHVDFLHKLQPFKPVICKLLAFLSDQDLAIVCCTSSEWRRVCHSVCEAKRRWEQHIKLKRDIWESRRENLPSKRPLLAHRGDEVPHPLTVRNSNSGAGDSDKAQVGAPTFKSRHQIYLEESKNLRQDELHLACPRCSYPSRVSRGAACAACKSPSCRYLFCGSCKRPPHDPGQPCPELSLTGASARSRKQVIGGKDSKRRLHRL